MVKEYCIDYGDCDVKHVVDATYLFGKTKLVLRMCVSGCLGAEALEWCTDADGCWIDDSVEVVEGVFEYDEENETAGVKINGEIEWLTTRDMQEHLVGVEISSVEAGDMHEID